MRGGSGGGDIGARLFEQWRKSPGHYANMVAPDANALGIGLAYNSSTKSWYGTQNFAKLQEAGRFWSCRLLTRSNQRLRHRGGPDRLSRSSGRPDAWVIVNDQAHRSFFPVVKRPTMAATRPESHTT